MLKRTVLFLSILMLLLAIPVSAEMIPEQNPIGETLVIEPDENIVIENLRDDDETEPPPQVIHMTRSEYLSRYVYPVLFWVLIGVVILLLIKLFTVMKARLS